MHRIKKICSKQRAAFRSIIAVEFKPKVFARLSKIASIGAAILLKLSGDEQMCTGSRPDDDEIVSNENIAGEFQQVSGWLDQCHAPNLNKVDIGIASKFEDDRPHEDLCSIPDLIGGAVAEQFNVTDPNNIPRSSNLSHVVNSPLSTKAGIVLEWAGNGKGHLKRHLILIAQRKLVKCRLVASFHKMGFMEIQHELWLPPGKG